MPSPRRSAAATLSLLALATASAFADDFARPVTYSEDVAPIFLARCVNCHRPGEGAPMTLTSYADARPWAKSIRQVVSERTMPPWQPDSAKSIPLKNDMSLSEAEIQTILRWIDAGAPEGDPAKAPALPKFVEGWQLGEPDYILELDAVEVPATGEDIFPNLYATIELPEDRWIRACEVRPGNPDVLHHVVAFIGGMGPGAGGGRGAGGGGAGAGASATANILTFWGAGTPPTIYPDGVGRVVKKRTPLTLNMHYHPYGEATTDKTRIGLYFGEREMEKEIGASVAGSFVIDIPPHAEHHEIEGNFFVTQDVRVASFFPHMHMRGKSIVYTAHFPNGESRTLLDIPRYDFNWQWFYYPAEELILPEGTRVHVQAAFDNSANNPNNPDPTIRVRFGEDSDEEMMFGVVEYVAVEGVRPKPASPGKTIDWILAQHPVEESFRVDMNLGMMKMPTAMHLPKTGEGRWYFVLGGMMFDFPIENVTWNGSEFAFDMMAMGAFDTRLKAKGTLAEDGSVKGSFELPESAPGGVAGGDPTDEQMEAARRMMARGFEGRRAG